MKLSYLLGLLTSLTCLGCARSEPEAPYSHAADFSYTGTLQNTTPIVFNSASPDAKSYSWNFGDGTALSTDKQPTHTFRQAGTYAVQLTVTTPGTPVTQAQTLKLFAADTLSPIFARIAGKYHISQSRDNVYDKNGLNSYVISRDFDVDISRSDNSLLLSTTFSLLPPKAKLIAAPPYQKAYVFSYDTFSEQGSITFSASSDSIVYSQSSYNIPSGSGATILYYGKKR